MARYHRFFKLVLGAALLAPVVAGGISACKPSAPAVSKAQLKSGDMPAGGEWRGVYYDQTYGYLHMLQDGDSINAKWRTAAGDKWGELHGRVEGDLLRYDWTEHRIGMYGPTADTSGKGYFRYVVPSGENVDHEIHGEWGLGESDAGNPWTAIKQRNMKPEPDSVMPDEHQVTVEGGDWDSSGPSDHAAGAEPDEEIPVPEGEEEGAEDAEESESDE